MAKLTLRNPLILGTGAHFCQNWGSWGGIFANHSSKYYIDCKKNGAARLDPWEIFLLLPLKIPVSFYFVKKIRKLASMLYDNCL